MPTPRTSGAPLIQVPFVTPGSRGLNKQSETSILDPSWATIATNAVFDSSGRLAARKGWANQTSVAMSGTPTIEVLHEQVFEDGTTEIISAAGSKLWKGVSTPTDITGASTVTVGNNWQFVNFNGKCLGFQVGEQPIVRTTGNFADLVAASGSAPTGNSALVHSGRVWGVDLDKQTIKYSALLDETHWATGAGNIDTSSVWPQGTDEITALAMFNGAMVVFGKNRIVLFGDGAGSALGINPANIYVYDTIVGVGCIARDTVQQVEGGDLLFLSAQGVQSLSRLIQEKSNPINNITKNIRDYLISYLPAESTVVMKSVYSPEESFYLLNFPGAGVTFCINTTDHMEDGSMRVTEWSHIVPRALLRTLDGNLYIAKQSGAGGKIGKYTGNQDNGTAYNFDYASAWLDIGQDLTQYTKILKNISGLFWVSANVSVSLKWDFDFQGVFSSRSITMSVSDAAEYGIGEFGIAEYGGGLSLRKASAPADGSGQYIRIGAQTSINGAQFAIQQINIFAKIGRLVK